MRRNCSISSLSSAPKVIGASVSRRVERGVALVVVMVLLIAITGVSVWTVRRSMMGENMARNQIDQQAAIQAAESALRDAERDIMNTSVALLTNASCTRGVTELNPNMFSTACTLGLCTKASEAAYNAVDWSLASAANKDVAEPWWPKSKGGLWNETLSDKPDRTLATPETTKCAFSGGVPFGTFTGANPIRSVARQPEYIIEVFRRKNVRINLAESQVTSGGEFANQWSTMYRITARGFGYSTKTQTVLQTIYFP